MNYPDILRLHGMTPELAEQFTEQGFHVGFIKNSEGEIEYTVPLPNAKKRGEPADEDLFIRQAPPVRITPTKQKPRQTDEHITAIVPDIQYGFRNVNGEMVSLHNQRFINLGQMLLKATQPDRIVMSGDNLDFPEHSKYEKDSEHFAGTGQATIDGLHRELSIMRANNPDADIHYLEGNHEVRLPKRLLKYTTQLANLRQANMPDSWHLLSVPMLLRLDELGINYHGGYPANEYEDEFGTVHIHGNQVRSNGSTADLYSKRYPENSVTFGHVHRHEMQLRTRRNGAFLFAATFGTWARTTGEVSSYGNGVNDRGEVVPHQENWQGGMGFIRRSGDNVQVEPVYFNQDGTTLYRGKEYRGEA